MNNNFLLQNQRTEEQEYQGIYRSHSETFLTIDYTL